MRALKKLYTILALGLAMLFFRIGPAGAAVFEVVIDTSGVSGGAVMAFDFSNSDPGLEHQLVISDFARGGSHVVSATVDPAACQTVEGDPMIVEFPLSIDPCKAPADGNVTGTLGGSPPVTISDAEPAPSLITYFQTIELTDASSISFRFEMSGQLSAPGLSPDGFLFSLLDPETGSPIVSSDESGLLVLYSFGGECLAKDVLVTCTEVRASVPEPTPLALTVAALLALLGARRPVSVLHRRRAVRA